jgi:hypothetical protein
MTFDEFVEARDPHIEMCFTPQEWHIIAEMLNSKGVVHRYGNKADPMSIYDSNAKHIYITNEGRFSFNWAEKPVTFVLFSELNDTTIFFNESDFLSLIE